MTRRRGIHSDWRGLTVVITCRLVSRYLWTTASIDVWLDGNRILRTGGVLKRRGSSTETFHLGNTQHEATVSWGAGRFLSFPCTLTIDGIVVAESPVFIENGWLLLTPLGLAIGVVLARHLRH